MVENAKIQINNFGDFETTWKGQMYKMRQF